MALYREAAQLQRTEAGGLPFGLCGFLSKLRIDRCGCLFQARLAQVYAELHEGAEAPATAEEALAYYHTASAAVLLHANAATVFMWLFCRIVPHFTPHTRQELAAMLAAGTSVPATDAATPWEESQRGVGWGQGG